MDLELTQEQRLIQQTMREFSKKEIGPHADAWDKQATVPVDSIRKLGPLGFLGALIPHDYGGAGLDTVSYLLALEELAFGDAGFAVGVAVHTSVAATPIVQAGSDEQKQRLLPKLASGQSLGAFALTEPQAGSDVAGIQTKAVADGDEYIINGSKVFITNGSFADQVIVAARTGDGPAKENLSIFVVHADTPGFERGGSEQKMGLHSSDTARLNFSDMRVPAANLLGREGDGFKILMETLNASRLGIGAQALGMGRRALEESLSYAKERKQFGKPLLGHQAVAFMLADMATKLEATRLLLYRAASDEDRGQLAPEHASMAKLFASESLVWIAEKAVQIHGGNGYIKDYVVERIMRDAPITRIYEGTSEIQKRVIARAVARA